MTKKILAMLLSVAMLAAIVVVPGYAATDAVSCDFNDSDDWYVGTVGGISGKSANDYSYIGTFDKYSIITLNQLTTFEYNMYNGGDYKNHLSLSWSGLATTTVLDTNTTKMKFKLLSDKTFEYPTGQWSRIAMTIDPTLDSSNLTLYINGTNCGTATITKPNSTSASLRVKLFTVNNYIDDFIAYHGAYATPTSPTLSTENTLISIDNDAKTISMPACAISDLSSKIAASDGTISGVVDADTYMTKTSGNVEDGDLIAVVANDGVTYSYYTVTLKETKSHAQNFDSVTISKSEGSWYTINSNTSAARNELVSGGVTCSAVGGKLNTDNSVHISATYKTDGGEAYFRFDPALYGKTTVEYSLLNLDTTDVYLGPEGYNDWINFGKSSHIYSDGSKYKNIVGSYEIGKWYRVVYDMNLSTMKYDAYVNGERIVTEGTLPSKFVEGKNVQFRFKGNAYFDDISIYSGSYTGANTTMPTLSSGTDYTVNEATKTVVLNSEIEATSAATAAAFGSNVTVVDPETNLTKTEGSIEVGDLIAVVSDDGLFFTYYTVVPADGISDISIIKDGSAFAGDKILETGSYQASVHITATDVNRSDSYELIIAKYEGSTLTGINVKAITAAPAAGSFVDADFTTDAVTVSNAATESLKAYLWDASDLTPIKYLSIPVFTTPQ